MDKLGLKNFSIFTFQIQVETLAWPGWTSCEQHSDLKITWHVLKEIFIWSVFPEMQGGSWLLVLKAANEIQVISKSWIKGSWLDINEFLPK